MADQYKVVCDLSNSAVSNNLVYAEWLSRCSRLNCTLS